MKRLICLLLALLLPAAALAGEATGTTIADITISVSAEETMTVEDVDVIVGQSVTAGQTLVTAACTCTYSPLDGTVVSVEPENGTEDVTISIAPVSLYTVYCTAEE